MLIHAITLKNQGETRSEIPYKLQYTKCCKHAFIMRTAPNISIQFNFVAEILYVF